MCCPSKIAHAAFFIAPIWDVPQQSPAAIKSLTREIIQTTYQQIQSIWGLTQYDSG